MGGACVTPLYATPQWIVVLLVPRPNGKTDKIPCDHRTARTHVDAHNPEHWTTHAGALATASAWGPQFTVGFVITAADPFWCLDIDGALDVATGQWSPLAQQLCRSLPNTCVEISQSGRGLHIWGQGPVPPHSMKNVPLHIELYSELRFIAIGTGAVGDMTQPCPTIAAVAAAYFPPRATAGPAPESGPSPEWRGPTDDIELLRRAMQSKSAAGVFGGKATFADLWHADAAVLGRAYPPDTNSSDLFDHSSADAALCQHLAFWTGRDSARIERLMRQSALRRDKWDDRADYLVERTITTACGQQRDVLQDRMPEPSQVAAAPATSPGMLAVEGNTFLTPETIAQLFKGCVYVVDAHRALIPGGRMVKPDQFRAVFGGYTFAMDARNERTTRNAWEAFTESQVLKAPRADGSCFRPDLPYGALVHDTGRVRVNTWWPVEVPRKRGDVTPFLSHLKKLLPVELDWRITLYYLAACVQHQGYKFQWAILLQGVEGNGKTLLSRCVAEAIGRRYVHWPKASKIAKQFNAWMVGKTFFAVEDIHTSEHVDVIEELKPMITGGDGLEIEAKGVDQISAEICGNFMFNSNHKSGLRKTRNDRRFCVLYCAQQTVDDLERDGMTADYMNRLYHWLKHEDGYAIVAEYLWSLEIPDEFNPRTGCQRAPRTSSTDAAIEAGLGRVEQEILEAIEQGLPGFAGGWVSSMAVDRLMDRIGRSNSVPPNRRREMLQGMGYDWHPALGLTHGRTNNVILPDAGKPRLFVRQGHEALKLVLPADVARAYTAAQSPA
jgi:hypothetical protein